MTTKSTPIDTVPKRERGAPSFNEALRQVWAAPAAPKVKPKPVKGKKRAK